jgi:hypothetical protein
LIEDIGGENLEDAVYGRGIRRKQSTGNETLAIAGA